MKRIDEIIHAFEQQFDSIGIIQSSRFFAESKRRHSDAKMPPYPTTLVCSLAYPKRVIKPIDGFAVPSFYTFGQDYHHVLKTRIHQAMAPFSVAYEVGVDNHPYDERLAAVLAGVGFFGRNQLIIHPTLGTYHFLGLVFLDITIQEEYTHPIDDSCGTCEACIKACPAKALSLDGYEIQKCISAFNQSKRLLTLSEAQLNYCLFGCDLCQLACPKNKNVVSPTYPEWELSGKELLAIEDLFTLTEKAFKAKYSGMAYLWKGKTILMRNTIALLLKQKNPTYNSFIQNSIKQDSAHWYREFALGALSILTNQNKSIPE